MSDRKKKRPGSGCLSEIILLQYLSGQISSSDKRAVEDHIRECEMCADALEGASMQDTKEYIKAVRRIDDRVDSKVSGSSSSRYAVWAAAACITIFLTGGLIWYQDIREKEREKQMSHIGVREEKLSAESVENLYASPAPETEAESRKSSRRSNEAKDNTLQKEVLPGPTAKAPAPGADLEKEEEVFAAADQIKASPPEEAALDEGKRLSPEPLAAGTGKAVIQSEPGLDEVSERMFAEAEVFAASVVTRNEATQLMKEEREKSTPAYSYKMEAKEARKSDGLYYYRKKEYDKAEEFFDRRLSAGHGAKDALLYRALSRIRQKKYELALSDAELLRSQDVSASEWIKALVYVRKGDRDNARQILERIAADEGAFKNNAKEMLNIL
jgi:tetratricopeptide (TPR) repeat protein